MAQRIKPEVTPIDAATATWVQALSHNDQRRFFGIYNETAATDIYIGFGAEPSDITTAICVKADGGQWESNVLELITTSIWVYHEKGSTITSSTATSPSDDAIKVVEGL